MAYRFVANNMQKLSPGCRQCVQGSQMVLFITGKCNRSCYYCPISSEKKGRDVVFANERPLKNPNDLKAILAEAKEMRAKGCGITGGEPLLAVERCCKYIRFLKKHFGKRFHIHLYTWGDLATPKNIKKLEKAGLDEIRFHLLPERGSFDRILPAFNSDISVGIEVPTEPGKGKALRSLLKFARKHKKIAFINLNEFEFSDTNWRYLEAKGFKSVSDLSFAVKGSKELALRLMKDFKDLPIHFCSVQQKTIVQLSNRLKRRSLTVKRPFEKVNEGGLIEKATIEGNPALLKKIAEKLGGRKAIYNSKKKRLECSLATAMQLKKQFGLRAFRLIEYPIFEPWDFEKEEI